mmetsp:Transcript_47115/g.121804  ORF Transcript_47115/g.121804 Transcript_47115/m.121804 type:complete len:215 (+) Transcript_47115:89-733(+)
MRVTFGSALRKAERRKRKSDTETRRSVQARIADLWSFFASRFTAGPRARDQRPSRRPVKAWGSALMTMSTSGTATPKAAPLLRLPPAKPTTSASGRMGQMAFFTARAICFTIASPSAVAEICTRSSSTSASQPTRLKLGATTGTALGRQTSGFFSWCCTWPGAPRGTVVAAQPASRCLGGRYGWRRLALGGGQSSLLALLALRSTVGFSEMMRR